MSYPRVAAGSAVPNLSPSTFPSMARRIGRLFPQAGAANLWPCVVPWADASDAYGVAYDSGTVGVVWTNDHTDYSDAAILAGLQASAVPVPGVLPSGYSLRLRRDRFPGTAGALNQVSGGTRKVRTPAGFANLAWYPQLGRTAQTSVGYSGNPSGGADTSHVTVAFGSMGFRGLEILVTFFAHQVPTPNTGSATFQISHNADGSTVTGLDGDTIDATFTVSAGELSYQGFGVFFSSAHQVGAIKPSLGVPSHFVLRATANSLQTAFPGVLGVIAGDGLTFHFSLRDDIPLPFTSAGRGGDIAPGGVIPGSVPGY